MSDFDKEAERERLREKYERDQEKREATEQMSELLLKGATMTNAHCDDCGDPIFRYEGEEFCPTCQEVVTDAEAAADATADGETEAGSGATANGETAAETTDDATVDGPESSESSDADPSAEHRPRAEPSTADAASPDGPTRTQASTPASPVGNRPDPRPVSAEGESEDPLGEARASLVRTVRDQARRAEQCSDPRRAKDHLAAAREAAETLAALY